MIPSLISPFSNDCVIIKTPLRNKESNSVGLGQYNTMNTLTSSINVVCRMATWQEIQWLNIFNKGL
jgi:hypothetical protein